MKQATIYLVSAVVLLALDSIYLILTSGYFDGQIRRVQGSPLKINLIGAVLCYVFLIFGINYFILEPKKSVYDAFLLGLVIYGVYETTSYALLKNWSFITVVLDTLWGATLFALTTWIISMIR